jgi:ABC-type ATPase involved in cell division
MPAIGRGFMSRSKILLLDEPLPGLAPVEVQEVFQVVKEINRAGTTILPANKEMKVHYLGAHNHINEARQRRPDDGRTPERHCGWSFSDNRSALGERGW